MMHAPFLTSRRTILLLLFCIHFCAAMVERNETSQSETKGFDLNKKINDTFLQYHPFAMYYFPEVHIFDKYFSILLFLIGFPGNLIAFLVWSSRRMYHGNSAAVYLAALSLNDTVVLAIALYRDITNPWGVFLYKYPGSCEVMETISITVQYASPIYVLAFTVERWLAICQPFMVSRICSVRRAVYTCFGIFLSTLCICSPMAFFYKSYDYGCDTHHQEAVFYFTTTMEIIYSLCAPLLVLTFNCLVINEMSRIQKQQMTQLSPGKMDTIPSRPFLILMKEKLKWHKSEVIAETLNVTTTPLNKFTKRSNQRQRRSDGDTEVGEGADSPKFKSTTIMLLVVSFYVIFATLLGGLMYLLDIKFSIDKYIYWTMNDFDQDSQAQSALTLRKVKIVFDELALSHFSMGFVLYFLTGRNFRQGVQRLFGKVCVCCSSVKDLRQRDAFFSTGRRKDTMIVDSTKISRHQDNSGVGLLHSGNHHLAENPVKLQNLNLKHFHRAKKDAFPGLATCGHRGIRQPSKLMLPSSTTSNDIHS